MLLAIALSMIGLNILFAYLELRPFLRAMSVEKERTYGIVGCLTAPFRFLKHLPKLIPTIIDLGSMWVLGGLFSLGTGLIGGVAGLFGSNVLSVIIYYHTHWKKPSRRECVA